MDYCIAITFPVELVIKIDEFEDMRRYFRNKASMGYDDRSEKKPWHSKPWKENNQRKIRKIISRGGNLIPILIEENSSIALNFGIQNISGLNALDLKIKPVQEF